MKKQYKASGLVYGKYWGGGEGAYQSEKYQAETVKELDKMINKGVKDGTIDSGMGYENVLGAVMEIEIIETIAKNDKEYSNSEFETESYGDLTIEQIDFCIDNFYN